MLCLQTGPPPPAAAGRPHSAPMPCCAWACCSAPAKATRSPACAAICRRSSRRGWCRRLGHWPCMPSSLISGTTTSKPPPLLGCGDRAGPRRTPGQAGLDPGEPPPRRQDGRPQKPSQPDHSLRARAGSDLQLPHLIGRSLRHRPAAEPVVKRQAKRVPKVISARFMASVSASLRAESWACPRSRSMPWPAP